MFSEENIERTKERLVEYVVDNAHTFTRKYDKGRGKYDGYWKFNAEELSVKPVEDAMEVLGTATTMDIIIETLDTFYNVKDWGLLGALLSATTGNGDIADDEDEDYYDDYDEDDYGYDDDYDGFYEEDEDDEYRVFISGNSPLSLCEWITPTDIKSNDVTELIEESKDENEEVSDKEMVNHPPHYNQGKFETIDIIEDIVSGYDDPVVAYLVGTTLKYLARAPFKNAEKQDLEKAEFYLKRAIDKLTNNSNSK